MTCWIVSGVKHHSGSISTLAARVKAQQLVPRGGLEAISPQRLSGLRRGKHARRALSARGERKSQVPGAALGSWAGHQPKMPSRQQTSLARQTASPSRPSPRVVGPGASSSRGSSALRSRPRQHSTAASCSRAKAWVWQESKMRRR